MITRIRDIAAAALDAAMRPSAHPSITADPVDAHAAEVTEQLGLSPRWAFDGHRMRYDSPVRYGKPAAVLSARALVENALVRDDLEDAVAAQTDAILTALHASGRLVEPGEDTPTSIAELRHQLRERNRQYGRASQTIGELRGDLARERERERTADQLRAVAARLSPDTAARSMIAEALGLPTDSTTGAIVVAIRGLRETAEQGRPAPAGAPSFHTFRSWLTQAAEDVDSGDATSGDALRALSAALAAAQPWSEEPILAALYSGVATDAVEVDADQVSLPVGAAVNAREEIDRLRADLGRAGATAEWVWDPRAELPTPDEFDEIIANRAGKGITYAFAPAAVRPLLAEVHLQRSAVEVLRLDNERLRMERPATPADVALSESNGHDDGGEPS